MAKKQRSTPAPEKSGGKARRRPAHDRGLSRSGSSVTPPQPGLVVAGLFAGIGGIERGMHLAGHSTALLCENNTLARAVLLHRFACVVSGARAPHGEVVLHDDVRSLKTLPPRVNLLTAGFPCQDLSQAGGTQGIQGSRSGLVGQVFRIVEKCRPQWLLIENVPFMLQLGRGRAMDIISTELERLDYSWAYRTIDTLSFGLPQRRRRVFLLASRDHDPREVLLSQNDGSPRPDPGRLGSHACGFYWTEGNRGLGWAADAIPTLKGGSTIGIPSPPAIIRRDGRVIKPDIRDAERLQGFPRDWTLPAEKVGRPGFRWKLVGNAVSVPVAQWIGKRLADPRGYSADGDTALSESGPWPAAAYNVGDGRYSSTSSEWPVRRKHRSLEGFLRNDGKPLSARATAGFIGRVRKSSLVLPESFLEILVRHAESQETS